MPWLAVQVALVAVVCFFLGSVNPASLLARALGRDLRSSGSGNPGATNAGRVLGTKWGVLVLVLDVGKAWLPTWVVLRSMGTVPALVAGFAVVLGHVYSPFLRGKGGKGVACALGTVLAVEPFVALGAVVVFLVTKTLVPFVGEASVVAVLGIGVVGLLGAVGVVPGISVTVGIWLVLISAVVLSRHRRNILAWWSRRVR
ncbi:glycerol-3-phosphate acyltransferase [Oryzobacter telluris]|uniref:glycerol-3-phosphate acyltransferase n=1 Tax=Oryzobacter telluris TaxID=3149179 RepID=UPI00370DBC51